MRLPLAEHIDTPLGYAPSPAVFLAATRRIRSRRLRFGVMVYLLPLYHPLWLIDEICMLDQMSGGRFLFGVGRGVSRVEVGFCGIDFHTGPRQFHEAFEMIRRGRVEYRLTFHGEFCDFDNVPIVVNPRQQPPPVWYGLGNPASVAWAAANAANDYRRPAARVRRVGTLTREPFCAVGRQRFANEPRPFIGMTQLRLYPAMGHPRPQAELAKPVLTGGFDGLTRQHRRLLGLSEHHMEE